MAGNQNLAHALGQHQRSLGGQGMAGNQNVPL